VAVGGALGSFRVEVSRCRVGAGVLVTVVAVVVPVDGAVRWIVLCLVTVFTTGLRFLGCATLPCALSGPVKPIMIPSPAAMRARTSPDATSNAVRLFMNPFPPSNGISTDRSGQLKGGAAKSPARKG